MKRLLPALLLLTACELKDTDVGCTTIAVWSTAVTVTDDGGEPVAGLTLEVTDGTRTEPCEDFGGGEYACGVEMAGELTISATGLSADHVGTAHGEATVTVGSDECHVIPEDVALQVDFECTDIGIAAAQVTVADSAGGAIDNATVVLDDDDASYDCDNDGSGDYTCWSPGSGDMTLRVDAEGYLDHTEDVTIETTEDGCHPETAQVSVTLTAE